MLQHGRNYENSDIILNVTIVTNLDRIPAIWPQLFFLDPYTEFNFIIDLIRLSHKFPIIISLQSIFQHFLLLSSTFVPNVQFHGEAKTLDTLLDDFQRIEGSEPLNGTAENRMAGQDQGYILDEDEIKFRAAP